MEAKSAAPENEVEGTVGKMARISLQTLPELDSSSRWNAISCGTLSLRNYGLASSYKSYLVGRCILAPRKRKKMTALT